MIFSEVLRSRCCSSRLAPNRGGPKIGPDSHQQRAISRSTVPSARLSIARFLFRSGRTGCLHPSSPKGGPRGFESCSLQRRVKANSASGYNAPNVRPTHLRKTPAQGLRSYSRRAAPQMAACRAAGALELPLPPRLFSGGARTCPAARSDGVRLVLDVIRETCGVWRSRFPIGSGSRIY